jgi:hypothetical protein
VSVVHADTPLDIHGLRGRVVVLISTCGCASLGVKHLR